MIIEEKVIEEHQFFDVVQQLVQAGPTPKDTMTMLSMINKRGDYVGEAGGKLQEKLLKHGIDPEMRDEDAGVCSIGWSQKEKKYYGWSHRAMVGFEEGDKVFDPTFSDRATEYRQHGRGEIKTKADARRAAEAFAEYMG